MGFMFCDLHISLDNPSSGDINSSNLPCLPLVITLSPLKYSDTLTLTILTVFDVIFDINILPLVISLSQLKYSDTLTLTILTIFNLISTHALICAHRVLYELFKHP